METKTELTPHEKEALVGVVTWDQYIENQKKSEEIFKRKKEDFLKDYRNDFYIQVKKDKFENTRVIDINIYDDDGCHATIYIYSISLNR